MIYAAVLLFHLLLWRGRFAGYVGCCCGRFCALCFWRWQKTSALFARHNGRERVGEDR